MSGTFIDLHINNADYPYPEPEALDWGQRATDAIIALADGTLQPDSGLFTMTDPIDFGALYGLNAKYFASRLSDPADAGFIRLSNLETIEWRNFANDANNILAVDNSDNLTYNGDIILHGSGGGFVSSIHADSEVDITGAVQLISGTGITLSQVGQAITVDNTFAFTPGDITESTSSVLTILNGTGATAGPNTTIEVTQAGIASDGYLSSTDWNTFNDKEPAVTKGNLTEVTSSILTITDGTGAVIGTGTTIEVAIASALQSGYLTSTDWSTFNGKQDALGFTPEDVSNKVSAFQITPDDTHYPSEKLVKDSLDNKQDTLTPGDITETTSSILTITDGTGATVGPNVTIEVAQASSLTSGYLSNTDWSTFDGKQDALGYTAANDTLSNLGVVAVNTSIISDTDNTDDLGSALINWKDIYAKSLNSSDDLTIAADPAGQITLTAANISTTGDINLEDEAELVLYQPTLEGSDFIAIRAPNTVTTYTIELPGAIASPGQVLTDVAGDGSLSWETPATTGATTALDNLASVAINTSLLSDTDNTDDLGSSSFNWRSLYLKTSLILQETGIGTDALTIQAASSITPYTITLPAAVAGVGQVLTDVAGNGVLSWQTPAGTGANTALSNLSGVAINTALLPGSDNAIDLGSLAPTLRFQNLYLSGSSLIGGATLNTSAVLQLDSTTKGFLPPRMSEIQKQTISTPAKGLTLFNNNSLALDTFDGTIWRENRNDLTGLNWRLECRARAAKGADISPLGTPTYDNGVGGVGATLTGDTDGAIEIDTVNLAVGNRVLISVFDGDPYISTFANGIYEVTQAGGAPATPYILTRVTDCDAWTDFVKLAVHITEGGQYEGNNYVSKAADSGTVGTDGFEFNEFHRNQLLGSYNTTTLSASTFPPISFVDAPRAGLSFDTIDPALFLDEINLDANGASWSLTNYGTMYDNEQFYGVATADSFDTYAYPSLELGCTGQAGDTALDQVSLVLHDNQNYYSDEANLQFHHNMVQTTDATADVVLQQIATIPSTTYLVEARVAARQVDLASDNESAGGVLKALYKTDNTGAISIVSTVDKWIRKDNVNVDINLNVDGSNNIIVTVTGDTAKTYEWQTTTLLQRQSFDPTVTP
jgi:hypothetical protein